MLALIGNCDLISYFSAVADLFALLVADVAIGHLVMVALPLLLMTTVLTPRVEGPVPEVAGHL